MDMNEILNYIENNGSYVLLIMSILQLLIIFLWITNTVKLKKMINKYKVLLQGTKKDNLEAILMDHLRKVEETQETLDKQRDELLRIEEGAAKCIQKVYTKRYNAFDNTGSDLSYSTALLDAHNSGFILTGIYGREYAVSYAKPIEEGLCKQVLSEEEKEALTAAMNQKILIQGGKSIKK